MTHFEQLLFWGTVILITTISENGHFDNKFLDILEMLFLIRAVDHARINSELKEKNLASLSIPMLTFLNLKSTKLDSNLPMSKIAKL